MATKKAISKKTVRSQIVLQLEKTFAELEQSLGKSQFRKNIKKASKALATKLKVGLKVKPKSAPRKKATRPKVILPKNGGEEIA